ncbi:MAG TPA: ABC transporter substrate-binding protein [Streptosporangiaceae bacterium]|nr:ABC transporter substrate-binding protein [Streptosporangiaceae bacterium]
MRLAQAGARLPALRVAPAFLLVALLVSGCSFLGIGSSGGASGSGQITVAVVPGIDNAPLQVAVQEGLFRQNGLNVVVKNYPSIGAEYRALTSGQAQVAAGDYTDFFYMQSSGGAKLRLIADGYDAASNSVAILTLPTSGITTPQQLQGLPGGVAAAPAGLVQAGKAVPFNIQTLAAQEVLQNDGVSSSTVTWTAMPPQNMIGALRAGQVKAILVTEPYILQAEEQLGAVELVNASTGVTDGLPMSGYFSLASYQHANPSAVQAFQKALAQAQSECAQRGLVQGALSHLTGMTTGESALVTLGTYPASLNVGQVQRVATLMYDSGMIRTPITVSSLTAGT